MPQLSLSSATESAAGLPATGADGAAVGADCVCGAAIDSGCLATDRTSAADGVSCKDLTCSLSVCTSCLSCSTSSCSGGASVSPACAGDSAAASDARIRHKLRYIPSFIYN